MYHTYYHIRVPSRDKPTLSYKDAGVDIDRGNALVDRIKPLAQATRRAGVVGGIGGFGALFDLSQTGYRNPILVSSTDGVGTKLRLAIELNRHDTIGQDLVAMCVNDVVVQGAEPLFFLDYFATGRLDVEIAARVIAGIAKGCELAGAALVGGETAEMPDMYATGDYDLAGFCVGVMEKDAILEGSKVQAGDALVGIASSGPHSNGYSLIRKVFKVTGADLGQDFHGRSLGETLLTPTRIYVKPLLRLLAGHSIHAMAHITGGGLLENIPRMMPPATRAVIDLSRWPRPPIFDWLQTQGNIPDQEMYRTFNCGVGMVLIVPPPEAADIIKALASDGEIAWEIGRVEACAEGGSRVVLA